MNLTFLIFLFKKLLKFDINLFYHFKYLHLDFIRHRYFINKIKKHFCKKRIEG